jgi:hypothetical protein
MSTPAELRLLHVERSERLQGDFIQGLRVMLAAGVRLAELGKAGPIVLLPETREAIKDAKDRLDKLYAVTRSKGEQS